jgi:hypothetical protein
MRHVNSFGSRLQFLSLALTHRAVELLQSMKQSHPSRPMLLRTISASLPQNAKAPVAPKGDNSGTTSKTHFLGKDVRLDPFWSTSEVFNDNISTLRGLLALVDTTPHVCNSGPKDVNFIWPLARRKKGDTDRYLDNTKNVPAAQSVLRWMNSTGASGQSPWKTAHAAYVQRSGSDDAHGGPMKSLCESLTSLIREYTCDSDTMEIQPLHNEMRQKAILEFTASVRSWRTDLRPAATRKVEQLMADYLNMQVSVIVPKMNPAGSDDNSKPLERLTAIKDVMDIIDHGLVSDKAGILQTVVDTLSVHKEMAKELAVDSAITVFNGGPTADRLVNLSIAYTKALSGGTPANKPGIAASWPKAVQVCIEEVIAGRKVEPGMDFLKMAIRDPDVESALGGELAHHDLSVIYSALSVLVDLRVVYLKLTEAFKTKMKVTAALNSYLSHLDVVKCLSEKGVDVQGLKVECDTESLRDSFEGISLFSSAHGLHMFVAQCSSVLSCRGLRWCIIFSNLHLEIMCQVLRTSSPKHRKRFCLGMRRSAVVNGGLWVV